MTDLLKKAVAEKATVDYIKSNMIVGLGTGSTANYVVLKLGELLRTNKLTNIKCVCTSVTTQKLAESNSIPVVDIDKVFKIDVAIDGADEVDSNLNLIKGRGGALFREKYVEQLAKLFVVIVDNSKLHFDGFMGPIPVEIIPYAYNTTIRKIQRSLRNLDSGCNVVLRKNNNSPYITDNNNYIVDIELSNPISKINALSAAILDVIGVIEHGIFIGMADICLVANSADEIDVMYSPKYDKDNNKKESII